MGFRIKEPSQDDRHRVEHLIFDRLSHVVNILSLMLPSKICAPNAPNATAKKPNAAPITTNSLIDDHSPSQKSSMDVAR